MSRRHAFITGIAGFAGSYLAEELLGHGYTVSGAIYKNESTRNIDHIRQDLRLVSLDILNGSRCKTVIQKLKPDYILHLAAQASVGRAFAQERLTYQVNFEGTLNILAAACELGRLKRFLFVSSSDCYGIFSPKHKILTESQPFNPRSPYGISKVAAENSVQYHCRQHGLPAVTIRSFNHSGPRQTTDFVIPSFARQIALIEAGRQKPVLKAGDLSARRDFSDVRDIVHGYRLAIERGKPGEVYQLCSGQSVAIRSVLNRLLSLSEKKIVVKINKSRYRKSDLPVLRGSNRKAGKGLGYTTRYPLKRTLLDTLEYWRGEVLTQR